MFERRARWVSAFLCTVVMLTSCSQAGAGEAIYATISADEISGQKGTQSAEDPGYTEEESDETVDAKEEDPEEVYFSSVEYRGEYPSTAQADITGHGWSYTRSEDYSDDYTYGLVSDFSVDPEGKKVSLVVSKGSYAAHELGEMDYRGWTREDAAADIAAKAPGWTVDVQEQENGRCRVGNVSSFYVSDEDKKVTLTVSLGGFLDDNIVGSGAYLTLSRDEIVIKAGESIDLSMTVHDCNLEHYYIKWTWYGDLTVDHGDWIGQTEPFTITGNSAGEGYMRFRLLSSSESEDILAYKDIYIIVE